MIKVNLNDVKQKILEYLEFDYGTTEMFIELCNKNFFTAYMFDDMIVLHNKRNSPAGQINDYKVFNFNVEKTEKFVTQLNSNDLLFFYDDLDIASDSLIFLDKEIFLCKKATELFNTPDVYMLTGGDNAEVMEFLNSSLITEKHISNESDALSTIDTIKFIWQEELKDNHTNSHHYCIKYDEKIIGMSEIKINPLLENKALLANIYIAEQFRGKGFGKRLLMASMAEKNYTYYYNCHQNNTNSFNTAISSGFQRNGISSVYLKK